MTKSSFSIGELARSTGTKFETMGAGHCKPRSTKESLRRDYSDNVCKKIYRIHIAVAHHLDQAYRAPKNSD
jgi:hypothetical protein